MASRQMFDAATAPAARIASAWKRDNGIKAVGVYIGGQYRSATNWTASLVHEYVLNGINRFLPIYVGQQAALPDGSPWGNFTSKQGGVDGFDAVKCAESFGWKWGHVALDVESSTVDNAPNLIEYVSAWCEAVYSKGYWPGVYAPARLFPKLLGTGVSFLWVAQWNFGTEEPGLDPDKVPGMHSELWSRHRAWQYTNTTINNYNVDLSCYNFNLNPPPGTKRIISLSWWWWFIKDWFKRKGNRW